MTKMNCTVKTCNSAYCTKTETTKYPLPYAENYPESVATNNSQEKRWPKATVPNPSVLHGVCAEMEFWLKPHTVTTLHTERNPHFSPIFLDEISRNISNKCIFINPHSPWTSCIKMNYGMKKVQQSYFVELPQSNFPDYTNFMTFPWLWAFSLTFPWP